MEAEKPPFVPNPPVQLMKIKEEDMMKVAAPIISKLQSLGITTARDAHGKYDPVAYAVVTEGLDKYDLSAVKYTYDDLHLLLTDKWGDMLRRPMLSGMATDFLREYPAETEIQQKLKDAMIQSTQAYAWEYYPVGIANRWWDVMQLAKEDKHYSRGMANAMALQYACVAKQMWSLNLQFYEDKAAGRDWMTDVGHGITQVAWPGVLFVPLEDEIKLKRPIRHLLVEDQIRSLWPLYFRRDLGYLPYPNDSSRVCPTAEEALELIAQNPPPDVITTDIELGKGMDGLEFARQARKRLGEETQIYVYSAYIPQHEEQLKDMVRAGVIQGYFSKQGLETELKAMVADETIQGYFSKHGFHINQLTEEINKRVK